MKDQLGGQLTKFLAKMMGAFSVSHTELITYEYSTEKKCSFSEVLSIGMSHAGVQNKLRWALGFLIKIFAEICKHSPRLVLSITSERVIALCVQAASLEGEFGTPPPEMLFRKSAWENRSTMVRTAGLQAVMWLSSQDSTSFFFLFHDAPFSLFS